MRRRSLWAGRLRSYAASAALWVFAFWPQASLCCSLRGKCRVPVVGALGRRPAGVAGGGADAKRWGNPAGVPCTLPDVKELKS